ncbi:MAG: hypothetical protein HWE22_11655 [Flavobacteriales bacterium]|nr:hypothetical protein [Flavobacteriales bacterium]
MKNTFLKMAFAAVAIIGITSVSSCKKGENDPFLSLRSRKARITGEWKLTKGTITQSQTSGGVTDSQVTTYTESTSSTGGFTSTYSETLTIEKDNTYEVVIVENGVSNTIRGNWYFSGKVKDADLKKKEAIVFSETQYISPSGTTQYTGLYADQILLMDQLKNKEVVFKGDITYSDSDGEAATYSYDRTFEKQ